MRIAITGSTGLVGKALIPALRQSGHQIVRLVRCSSITSKSQSNGNQDAKDEDTAQWQPGSGAIDLAALGDIDAVIHLAGENVASGRWTKARKQRISNSRGATTQKLCHTLATLAKPPRVMISASAVGIYGDRGPEELDEQSSIATSNDFLAAVAKAWEAGTQPLAESLTRIVHLRIGIVLDATGGALQRMLLPFQLGLGGRLGNGNHWMSWITSEDLVRVVLHALSNDALQGPVLAVAPNPVTNREFTRTLGKVLHRPTLLPIPVFALKTLFGEMSSILLNSQRARPVRLLDSEFEFHHETLEEGLRAALKK